MKTYTMYVVATAHVCVRAKNREEALDKTDDLDFGDLEFTEATIEEEHKGRKAIAEAKRLATRILE